MDFTAEELADINKFEGVNENSPKHVQIEFLQNVLELSEEALKDMEERFKLGLEEPSFIAEINQMRKQQHIVRSYLHKLYNS